MYVSMKRIESDHIQIVDIQQQNDTMDDDTLWNQTYSLGIQGHCDNI